MKGVQTPRADILILSSAIGSGHMRASTALSKGVKLLDPQRECLTVDFPREVSPAVEELLRRTYLESLKLMPNLYGKIYRMSQTRATQQSAAPRRASELYERVQRISELWVARYEPMYPEGGNREAPLQRQ